MNGRNLAKHLVPRGKFSPVDIFMPGVSGIEGIERIRRTDPEVKIVAISGADIRDGWSSKR